MLKQKIDFVKFTSLLELTFKLFTVMDGKFKFSAQGSDLAQIIGNGTKVKIPSEIKPPLVIYS